MSLNPPPIDKPLQMLFAFSGALIFTLLAFAHIPTSVCQIWGDVAPVAYIYRAVCAATALFLFCHASLLTFRLRTQTRSLSRLLESQALLSKFERDFDDKLTQEEFLTVAIRVLSEFSRYFGADQFLLEIVEPRTGVTVEQFLDAQSPPSIEPEFKAEFLRRVGPSSEDGSHASSHFIALKKVRTNALTQNWTTTHVAAGVKTPLGRLGILQLVYSSPRRTFTEDEISLLCVSLSGLIQTAVDHCKRKNREDLERRLKHAERVQAVGTLAGGIAHEFNNILGAILGYGELALQRASESSDVGHYLTEIMTTAKRAEYIVNQILTLSRSREQERKPFNLVEAIADALPLISASLPDLEVNARLEANDDCVMLGHPVELQQVVMNLCKNAWEATSGHAHVDIDIKVTTIEDVRPLSLGLLQPATYVCIRVADNGKGIASDILPHIFEPFFTTKDIGGTGLGLAAVHGLVTALDGRIDVTSEIGKGACFEIYFPQSKLDAVPVNQFFTVPQIKTGDGELVALLEPKSGDLAMHEEKIAALGYEPVGFSDMGRMEFWLSKQTPDLIMIDVRSIPAGYSTQDIECMARRAPVILMSHLGQAGPPGAVYSSDITWLRKPFGSKALADAISGRLCTKENGGKSWSTAHRTASERDASLSVSH